MGKRKTPVFRDAKKANTNTDDSKINAIHTWDDIEHDSEDEFHEDREKILLNNNQESEQDESDREIYGLEGLDSEEELSEDEIIGKQEEEETEDKTWGTSKNVYYDADEGDDLDEMREEEEEALRIQKEQLSNMDEADFVDDALAGWGVGANEDAEADKKLVEDVSKELEDISFDTIKVEKRRKNLPIAEKLKLIQNESPELIDLLDEFKEKSSTVKALRSIVEQVQSSPKREQDLAQFILFKYQTYMNYLTNISFYFALKASESNDVRDHPVIQALVNLRQTLEKLETLDEKLKLDTEAFINSLDQPEQGIASKEKIKKTPKKTVVTNDSDVSDEELEEEQEEEESAQDILNEIEDIEQEFKSLKKLAKKRKRVSDDFGELDALDELDMEDKIAKKKSLRDYVVKIDATQAKNKNKYQGDVDLPYRERNKRERKGVAQPQDNSADLDNDDWDQDDTAAANAVNHGEEDDYYANIAADKKATKQAKQEEYEASRPAIESRDIEVEEGQKRLASYKILKNKGLTPHRKKENRNARVKHRNKYAKQMKKLSSTRAVFKGQTSGYGGEMSGVKTNIVKSVKLAQ
ncbi:Sas10 C-terminal domain-containing protein [Gilbertella persicaria]|uniref:Sas10 C-terminal domain-containing protein n=1 Tax=Gilbertella persicaria TaxID=101096 RepID=UPI00221F4445|nr:Sas10 C-terminal domain-containing protein [Gilbertella persicaria]KAI8098147.1 Sas10 C-terminal domain-containing protein [Gilbertella persicaria]